MESKDLLPLSAPPVSSPNNDYWVYIVSNNTRSTLYIGVTSELEGRVWAHRTGAKPGSFSERYHCGHLVYFEHYREVRDALRAGETTQRLAAHEKECADRDTESALGRSCCRLVLKCRRETPTCHPERSRRISYLSRLSGTDPARQSERSFDFAQDDNGLHSINK